MVEIAKAVSPDVRVLCMDEPTDVLTGSGVELLVGLVFAKTSTLLTSRGESTGSAEERPW